MKYFYFLLLTIFIGSCKKDGAPPLNVGTVRGVWIEKSLRLDTLDFNTDQGSLATQFDKSGFVTLYSKPYSPGTEHYNKTFFSFTFEGQAIRLRNTLSAYYDAQNPDRYLYSFIIQGDKKAFSIRKFYERPGIPDMLVFERLQ